jgi:hypothetical protein
MTGHQTVWSDGLKLPQRLVRLHLYGWGRPQTNLLIEFTMPGYEICAKVCGVDVELIFHLVLAGG